MFENNLISIDIIIIRRKLLYSNNADVNSQYGAGEKYAGGGLWTYVSPSNGLAHVESNNDLTCIRGYWLCVVGVLLFDKWLGWFGTIMTNKSIYCQ